VERRIAGESDASHHALIGGDQRRSRVSDQ
jgi:hypothetical protein